MSVQTATNRFIVPPKTRFAELYQQLLSGFVDYKQLGSRLIGLLEQARTLRQFDLLSEYALILSNFPSQTYQTIGQYYLGLSLCQNGSGELDKAQAIFEKVASVALPKYRAEAMLSLSSIACIRQKPDDTLKYCGEVVRLEGISVISAKAISVAAILKSFEGYHRSAVRDLENLYPLIKYAPAHIYLDYLNSLAVELAECDRFEEARNITRITCGSPLIVVYPEWRDTANDLALRGRPASRSVVALGQIQPDPDNVLQLPQAERGGSYIPARTDRPARILNYAEWKKKMVKEPNDKDKI
jgi:tetratricopeptide (TPR) repeat protein